MDFDLDLKTTQIDIELGKPLIEIELPGGARGLKGEVGAIGPQGPQGIPGPQGVPGEPGEPGPQGIQGETGPANTLSIGTVESGEEADATITGDAPNQTLNLTLPKGDKGDTGETGPQGIPGSRGETGATGPKGDDGFSPTITTSKSGKTTTITITDAQGTSTATILDGADGQGSGDMLTSVYDVNVNGIVDNSEKVNNHTVDSDVPANAKFSCDISYIEDHSTITNEQWQEMVDAVANGDSFIINNSAASFQEEYLYGANCYVFSYMSDNNILNRYYVKSTNNDHRVYPEAYMFAFDGDLDAKQDLLVSGTNIKTINNTSLLGSGNITLTTTESDPIFTASAAYEITTSDIDRWDLKSDFSGSYTDLESLPKINNVTLTGNKTTSDLGIQYEDLTDKPTFDASFVYDAIGSTITNLQYYNLSMAGPDDYAKVIKILGYTASFEYDTNGIILNVLRDGYVERYYISKTIDNHTVTKTIVNLATDSDLATKQDTLVSGTNIKTVNSTSLLGSGNLDIGSEKLPIGSIKLYAGSTAPDGYLFCDGQAVSRTTYSDLFTVIGTTYGPGDGSTTFNLPNLKGRVAVGLDGGDTDFDTLGLTGGSKYLQAHSHTVTNKYGNVNTGSTWAGLSNYGNAQAPGTTTINTQSAGEGDSGNLQPYIILNYIIKASDSSMATLLEAEVHDGYNISTTDAYSCNYVNTHYSENLPIGTKVDFDGVSVPSGWEIIEESDEYLTTEVKTNKTWIDGKPIYRKVVTASALANNGTMTINHGIINLDTMVDQKLRWYDTTDKRWFNYYRYDSASIMVRTGGITPTSVELVALGVNWSTRTSNVSVTLEYTKTTD